LLSASACQGELTSDAVDGSTGEGPGGTTEGQNPTAERVEGIGYSTRFPRLSHSQWENTVRDLLRLSAVPGLSSTFSLDPSGPRFETFGERTISPNLWIDYQRAAEIVAKDVAQDSAKLGRAVSAGALGSARAFVSELGGRAFRRPLVEAEIAGFVALFEQAPALFPSGDAFATGAELVIRALLQSPHFLYRVESSTQADAQNKVWLNDYEIASRLSYAFWNSMPSDELLAAAAAGELRTPDGVAKWSKTMLADARAKEALLSFHEQLFNVDSFGTISKNALLYPTYSDALGPALREEARLFFQDVVVQGGKSIAGLLTTPVTYVNAATAPFYGLSGNFGDQLTRVELDPARRAGFLTHIGFLSRYGSQAQSDPILRGVHVSHDIICAPLPAPPNDVPPLPEQMPGQTNRQRVETVTGVAPCSGCHERFINPLGFAFEHYDAIGQWRDMDNEQPVNAAGSYNLDEQDISFNGAVELSHQLAESPSVHRCYTESWLEFVMGRKPAEEEAHIVDQLASASLSADNVVSLISNLTALDTFRARPKESL
jgi:hypothetical protein